MWVDETTSWQNDVAPKIYHVFRALFDGLQIEVDADGDGLGREEEGRLFFAEFGKIEEKSEILIWFDYSPFWERARNMHLTLRIVWLLICGWIGRASWQHRWCL